MQSIPETDEILNTGLGSGRPYLGSPKVVDGILREYLSDLVSIRTAQVERGDDPVPKIIEIAKGLQSVFYGLDARFQPFAWNKPGSLGAALVNDCGIGGEVDDAVYRLAVRIAKEHLSDLVAYEAGRMDDEHIRQSIDDLLKRYTVILSGAMIGGGDAR